MATKPSSLNYANPDAACTGAATRVIKVLERAAPVRGKRETFEAFVKIATAALIKAPEKEWNELINGWEKRITDFSQCLGELLTFGAHNVVRDVIGTIYMQWEIGNARAGQYFTPWTLAKAMALMTLGKPDEMRQPTADNPLTVCDPACGSGIMLLAAADTFPKEWIHTGLVHFTGIDIDPLCCRMANLNGLIYGLHGDIICGNALEMNIGVSQPQTTVVASQSKTVQPPQQVRAITAANSSSSNVIPFAPMSPPKTTNRAASPEPAQPSLFDLLLDPEDAAAKLPKAA